MQVNGEPPVNGGIDCEIRTFGQRHLSLCVVAADAHDDCGEENCGSS